jgi:hypothetical protein
MPGLLLLSIALCLIAGAAIDTGSICAVRAARDLSVGKPAVAVGSVLAVACASLVFYVDNRLGWQLRPTTWSYPTILTFVGAVVFAWGALVNGACAIGTIGRLARGDIGYIATLAGAGAVAALLPVPRVPNQMPDLPLTTGIVWLSIVGGFTLVVMVATRRHLRAAALAAFAVIGFVGAAIANVQGDWTWLSLIAEIRSGLPLQYATAACVVAAILGAALSAVFRHRFHLVRADPQRMLREAAGGGLMSAGATLIPGGNDALLVTGVPSGSPLAIIGYLVMFSLMVAVFRLVPLVKRWANWD